MKINIPVRFKNWAFWMGLVATILAAMGVSAQSFTSWAAVWDAVVALVTNPFRLGCVIVAVMGVFTDPTTKGICDSDQAMSYKTPK